MHHYYTGEKNHQILISLLKQHNIKNVVASPGTANTCLIGSIQDDPFFNIISAVDERSAAYIACGLSREKGEPVVLSCTGATASREYMPALTEAFYSKLPILVVTSSQPSNRVGHLIAQVTDRSTPPSDVTKISVELPTVRNSDDEWQCTISANKAILELFRHGGGPAHINLITAYSYSEEVSLTHKELVSARKIERYEVGSELPSISCGKVGIFVGSHAMWEDKLLSLVEDFCSKYNAVVFCDHTSNYYGKYKNFYPLSINQACLAKERIPAYNLELCIHIGEVCGEEGASSMIKSRETWRVSPDGEIRDYFRNLSKVFEMSELLFFKHYCDMGQVRENTFIKECDDKNDSLKKVLNEQVDNIPMSNVWIAQKTAGLIPEKSCVTLSILNTLRTWNYAEFKNTVHVLCPTGGFGIDGIPSISIGASLANTDKLSFCIVGDLAFFYDMNSLGNRFVGNNLRILMVNNGCGVEFKKSYSLAYSLLGEDVNPYVAAKGHFGNKSPELVKHYASDLGFKYICASTKKEFEKNLPTFVSTESAESIVFEVFVSDADEVEALNIVHNRK